MTVRRTRGGEDVLDLLRPGLRVFVQGAVGEPLAFAAALAAAPDRAAGVEFTQPGIPGVNLFDYAGLHPQSRLTAFMAPAGTGAAAAGRIRLVPLSYGGAAAYLQHEPFDLVVLQVTPPDRDGLCAFGISGDFGPLVWSRARHVAAYINPDLPRPAVCETIPVSALHTALEAPGPLPSPPPARSSPALEAAAATAAALVDDGAVVQTGVGAAPAAVLERLQDRRSLVIRSGLITDAHVALHGAGALSPTAAHEVGVAWGSQSLYAGLQGDEVFRFASVARTHDPWSLSRASRFTAINSALEVDLFGQANVEWRGGRAVSGVGGAPEFARAAQLSKDGISIIVLPSRAGGVPRIVPRLTTPTVSLPRGEVDVVVTEWGAARLRRLSLEERAEALIAIAHPDDRKGLGQAFAALMDAPTPRA